MSTRLALTMSAVAAVLSSLAPVASADRAYAPSRPSSPPAGAPASSHRFAQPPGGAADISVPPDRDVPNNAALDRATVRAALANRRARNLATFRAYQTAGVFPSNVYQPHQLNVWRDQDNHYCAAATIIRASGQEVLVGRVADQNNFIRLADVTAGPLMDWMLTSGLTQEEIAMIQLPFEPVTREPAPAPAKKVAVAPDLRAQETARLVKAYRQTDATLVAQQARSLDLATDRLLKRPQLAWTVLE